MIKRMLTLMIIIQLFFFAILGRLIQVQLVSTENFTDRGINLIEASVKQRVHSLVLDDGRGDFIDRNGEPLTAQYKKSLLLFPFLKKMDWSSQKIANIIQIDEDDLRLAVNQAENPFVFLHNEQPLQLSLKQAEEINRLHIPGVMAEDVRYPLERMYAKSLIGVLSENEMIFKQRYPDKLFTSGLQVGVSGLEKSFDEFLMPEGEKKILYHVDAIGGPLFGADIKYTDPANEYYPLQVQTTLDMKLQQTAEDIVSAHHLQKGGLVLIDIEKNSVLAMVNTGAENKMIEPQIPGSIFKIVTAASAIENNVDNGTFNCNLDAYGNPLPKEKQEGKLSFAESFARSCNYTFATLANQMAKNNSTFIDEYATKLGLVQQIGWSGQVYHIDNFSQLANEYEGTIWNEKQDRYVTKAVAQTAMGQKNVRVTPLAVANMMATLARNGEARQVKIADSILYKNGGTLLNFPNHSLTDASISTLTASKLQQLLSDVVESDIGTGRRFQQLPYKVAGKSGTAETEKMIGNEKLYNKWFAGFFPKESPRYALVVVDLDQTEKKYVTNDVFADVVTKIYELEHEG